MMYGKYKMGTLESIEMSVTLFICTVIGRLPTIQEIELELRYTDFMINI